MQAILEYTADECLAERRITKQMKKPKTRSVEVFEKP
jgi:hypothetical protein